MKIACPNCNKVHDVEEGALNFECPDCKSTYDIQSAKQFTLQKYKEYQNLGYNNLYLSLDFDTAYENYLKALEIKPNDLSSVMGLCLSKTSMSTFEHTYFDTVIKTIDNYEIYLNLENTFLFLNFIGDLLDQINFYYTEVETRCIVDKTFVNKMIFDEYVKSSKDIKELLAYLRSTFEIMDQSEFESFKENNPNFISRLEKREADVDKRLNSTYNVNHFGDIKLDQGETTILNENKIDLESDEVSNSNLVVKNEEGMKIKKIFWPITGILILISVIMMIVFLITKNNIFMYIFAGTGALALLSYSIYYYLFRKTLK